MYARIGGLALASVLVGSLLLAACTTPAAPSATPDTAGQSTAPQGSLTIAGQFGVGILDPMLNESTAFRGLSYPFIDSLVYYTSDDKYVPGIAERWEFSPDGKSLTFYIRKGVKFQDGSDLTGADVKFSLERMTSPASSSQPSAAQWKPMVDSVVLKDDSTVVLNFKQPRFDMPSGIDTGMGAVMPKNYIESKGAEYFAQNPMGSGNFKVVKYVTGVSMQLEAVDAHWRVVPQFKNITLLNIAEESTRLAMLKTGELDLAPIKPDWVPQLQTAGLKVFRSKPGLAGRYFQWPWFDKEHPESSPLGDVRVRKAIQLAINSKEIADQMFGGYGGPYALLPMMPTAYFADPNQIKIDPFDPEGAKKLLADAGYANGFSTKLWDSGGGNELSLIIQALAGYYRKIGVNAEIVPIEWATLRSKYVPKLSPDVWGTLFTFTSYLPQQFGSMVTFYNSKTSPSGNINDPKLDELLGLVTSTLDPVLKKQYATQAAVLAKNAYTSLSIVELDALVAANPKKIADVQRVEARSNGVEGLTYETIIRAK